LFHKHFEISNEKDYNSIMTSPNLSHIDDQGKVHMVDVGQKLETERIAIARGEVKLAPETLSLVRLGLLKKGDVLTVAQIAGIMAAKHTSELIPLCHPIPISQIEVDLEINDALPGIQISALVRSFGKTGAEMEALTAVSVAALTVYDMVKAVEKTGRIQNIRLVQKHGGQSGDVINES
jgi:cyclic pyranopterin phosphate synthase